MGRYIFGVPQDSIVRPLLFNFYICDLFQETIDLEYVTLANRTTLCTSVADMISHRQKYLPGLVKDSIGKCYLLTSSKVPETLIVSNLSRKLKTM